MNTENSANVRPAPHLALAGIHVSPSVMTIEAWILSEIKGISTLVDQLMRLIEGSRCVAGYESAVELALREALSNAVIHGNEMDAHKLVQVGCRYEAGNGVRLTVKDQGKGFDPAAVSDPVTVERLEEEHGRGIHLMKLAMDQVCFEDGGTVVHMWKGHACGPSAELRTNNASAGHAQVNDLQQGVSVVAAHTNAVAGHTGKQLEDGQQFGRDKEKRYANQHCGD
jgi:serine/threonine-protein kinase RsbW